MTTVQQVESQTNKRDKEREAAVSYDALVANAKRLVKALQSNTALLGELVDLMRSFSPGKAIADSLHRNDGEDQ